MKKRVYIIATILGIAFSAANAWALDSMDAQPLISDEYPNALGFYFGTEISPVSVFNLHYQRWLGNLGFAANIGAMKDFVSVGSWGADAIGMLQYKFSDGNLISNGDIYGALYGFFQTGYVAQSTVTTTYDPETGGSLNSGSVFSQYIPVGIGVGMEAVLFKHVSFPLEVGFQYRLLSNYFGPSFSTGLRYRF